MVSKKNSKKNKLVLRAEDYIFQVDQIRKFALHNSEDWAMSREIKFVTVARCQNLHETIWSMEKKEKKCIKKKSREERVMKESPAGACAM